MKGVCLVSGGLDSTLTLIRLLEQGNEVIPMFVDYGQWSLEGEYKAVCETFQWLRYAGLNNFSRLLGVITCRIELDEDSVGSVWGRGIVLVGLAAMWAYTHGNDYDFIALGNHKGDVGPDCKPNGFDLAMNMVLSEATKGRISLSLPIRELTTEDIGEQLGKIGIPFNLMFSCYWGPPCGYKSPNETYRCPGCRRKTLAMKAAGITDENLLNFPNGAERSYQSPLAERVNY